MPALPRLLANRLTHHPPSLKLCRIAPPGLPGAASLLALPPPQNSPSPTGKKVFVNWSGMPQYVDMSLYRCIDISPSRHFLLPLPGMACRSLWSLPFLRYLRFLQNQGDISAAPTSHISHFTFRIAPPPDLPVVNPRAPENLPVFGESGWPLVPQWR